MFSKSKLLQSNETPDRPPVPRIFDYDDYRKFLKARFEHMKAMKPKYSYRYLANKVGSTDNYFKYIFDGKKNISLDRVMKTAKAFKLGYIESQYLMFQIIRQSITEKSLARDFDRILFAYKNYIESISVDPLSKLASDYNLGDKNILQTILPAMTGMTNFKWEAKWIQNNLHSHENYSAEDV